MNIQIEAKLLQNRSIPEGMLLFCDSKLPEKNTRLFITTNISTKCVFRKKNIYFFK